MHSTDFEDRCFAASIVQSHLLSECKLLFYIFQNIISFATTMGHKRKRVPLVIAIDYDDGPKWTLHLDTVFCAATNIMSMSYSWISSNDSRQSVYAQPEPPSVTKPREETILPAEEPVKTRNQVCITRGRIGNMLI